MISSFSCEVTTRLLKTGLLDLRLTVKNETFKPYIERVKVVKLGLQIAPELWHPQSWILGNDENTQLKNQLIRDLITRMDGMYYRLKKETGKEPTAPQVVEAVERERAKQNKPRKTLLNFIPEYITNNQLTGQTADAYKENIPGAVRGFLTQKLQRDDIYLDEIDTTFMYRFEMYMNAAVSKKGKPYKPSTIAQYIKNVVAIIHHALKIGEIEKNPLEGYVANTTTEEKKVAPANIVSSLQEAIYWKIPPEALHKIETQQVTGYAVKGVTEDLESHGNQSKYDLARPRLIFLLQTWTGFAFADVVAHKDLRPLIFTDLTGRKSIVYYRAKNGELGTIPVFEQTLKLLEALEFNAQPQCSYDTFNRKMKALLRYYVIPQPEETVTHLGRHVFGSRMLSMGFSMEAISRMMGHASIQETQNTYARVDLTKIQSDYARIQLTEKELGTKIAI